jgi:hypothetical protein
MDTVVYGALLTKADLAQLLKECTKEYTFLQQGTFLGEDFPLRMVNAKERDTLIRFLPFDPDLPSEMYAHYTFGRIFHADFELRWQGEAEQVRVVYIGNERKIPFLGPIEHPELEKRAEQQCYYLFGERLRENQAERIGKPVGKEDFAEARIPRLLHYPINGQKRYAQLVVQEYLDKATGQVALYRFVAVKEA